MDKEVLDVITDIFNRSASQTNFLYSLVENNLNKLIELETKIKQLHISYCPGNIQECDEILKLGSPKESWFIKPTIILH